MTIRLLIADDQELIRTGFRMILSAHPDIEVVGESPNGTETVRLARQLRPDIVLMDIRMPEMDGIEATKRILADGADKTTRILILTTFDLDQYVYDALRAGASGFLLKDVPSDDLANAIRTVSRDQAILAPRITKRLIEEFTATPRTPETTKAISALSSREVEVFRLVAQGKTNLEIAAELFVAETTIKTHVARIMAKLALRDRVQAVILAYDLGLVAPTPSNHRTASA
jgi:DNA-binding NarL/FixJ family response regulator